MTPITKEEYIKLINEDLEWLLQQPQTLERDHIEIVLKESINKYYPINEEELDRLANEHCDEMEVYSATARSECKNDFKAGYRKAKEGKE